MKKPKVSVIIPVYNAEATIIKCLRALKKQTLKPVEIIVVDDGSTDNSKLKIKKTIYQPVDKIQNLILLEQEHQGAAKARNLGVQKAKGEIVAFTDSDCVPPEDWLKKIVIAFSDSDTGAVGGGYSLGIDNTFWQRFSNEELFYRRQKRDGPVETLVSNNMACRKVSFLEANGFPEQYPVCEDMLLSFNISQKHKVLWLKDNGVQHHFKNSLKDFLKHQYFFGKESTRFFLDNPKILISANHQGKNLHLSIVISFLALFGSLMAIIFLIGGKFWFTKVFWGLSFVFILAHLFLYFGFLSHLAKKDFPILWIFKAYLVSFLRDLVSGFSFFDGFVSFFRKSYNV